MRLLAIDTSSSSTIVAAADGERLAVRRHDPVGGERPQHTSAGLVMAADALGELGLTWTDLERVGIGVGPGSFTGLRAGLSAAAGLARRLGIPLVAVTGAAMLRRAARLQLGADRAVLTAVDGRRRELFVTRSAAGVADDAVTALRRDALATLGDLTGWVAVGDGAPLERDALVALGAEVPESGSALHRLQGEALAALTREGAPQAADAVRLIYGRAPDAIPTAAREAAAANDRLAPAGSDGR